MGEEVENLQNYIDQVGRVYSFSSNLNQAE